MNQENPLYRQNEVSTPPPKPVDRREKLVNWSFLILFVAAILTLPAGIAFWQERTLTNEEGFIKVGNKVLKEPAVQKELARGLTDDLSLIPESGSGSPLGEIVNNNPGLGSLLDRLGGALGNRGEPAPTTPGAPAQQPSLLASIAERMLASSADSPLSAVALAQTREEVLRAIRSDNPTPDDESIVLDLGATLREVLPTGGAIIGGMLPDGAGRVEVLNSSDLTLDFTMARAFDGRSILWLLLPLAVFATGFFVAPNWARYCFQGGIALAVSAVLWVVYVMFIHKPMAVGNAIHDEQTRDAGNATYDVITGSLVQQELIVIGVGLVIAALSFAVSKRDQLIGQRR